MGELQSWFRGAEFQRVVQETLASPSESKLDL